jgi:hypothetical protein
MAFPQSKYAYASITQKTVWFICDRCGFRKNRDVASFQHDWRGLQLANLRILVCDICLDNPQPQLKPILVGPDPVPVVDPRPGFAATQMGSTPTFNLLEIIDGDLLPSNGIQPTPPPPAGYGLTDGAGNVVTDGAGNAVTDGAG